MYRCPERCFIDIINYVQGRIDAKNADYDENVYTSLVSYSKMRNFGGVYGHGGAVKVGEKVWLRFYFSNRRSYISVDCKERDDTDYNMTKSQYLVLRYAQKLFGDYNIDSFINGLHQGWCKE